MVHVMYFESRGFMDGIMFYESNSLHWKSVWYEEKICIYPLKFFEISLVLQNVDSNFKGINVNLAADV